MIVNNIYISWLNYLGGFEYFLFTSRNQYNVGIIDSGQTSTNLFSNWPESYGHFADTIDRQTFTNAKDEILVKSQHLTINQVEALSYIKISPVVQIVYSRNDRVTVLPDKDSFKKYAEDEILYSLQFTIKFTNYIPSQRI